MATGFAPLPFEGPLFLGIAEGRDAWVVPELTRIGAFRWFCLACAPRGPRKTPPEEPEFAEGAEERQASVARANAPLSTASSRACRLAMSLRARDRLRC